MMKFKSHGTWSRYNPSALPKEGVPEGVLWAQRDSDGKDWYDYVNDKRNFGIKTLKFMVKVREDLNNQPIVGPTVFDQTMLFPAGQTVFEILDYAGTDPVKDFRGKVYNHKTGKFSAPIIPARPPSEIEIIRQLMTEILRRVEKLEKK
jgi:hypothetical protein